MMARGLAGDDVDVRIELDAAPREVTVPDDLAAALATDEAARSFFDALSYTYRKEWVRWVEDARKAETRTARRQGRRVATRRQADALSIRLRIAQQ